jgi:enoyl-CoA hydratase/carnithine racemase
MLAEPDAAAHRQPSTEDVVAERHGGVLLIRLNRPHRHNAVGGTLFRGLLEAFDAAAHDDDVRAVVTTGNGPDFCVGADVADFPHIDSRTPRQVLTESVVGGDKGLPKLSAAEIASDDLGNAGRWALRMWALEKPTIAAVNGCAVGGGFGVALLHDIRLAGRTARLGPAMAPAGLAAELGMSLLLPRVVGASRAAQLMFTGRLLAADEAHEQGLVSEVVDDAMLVQRALELGTEIASHPPLAARLNKRLLRLAGGASFENQLRAEYAAQLRCFEDPESSKARRDLMVRVLGGAAPLEEGDAVAMDQ